MSSIRLKITCIVTMEAGPQLTLQIAKNTSMFSAQHTSNSNSLSVEEMPQRPFSPPTKPASFLSYGLDIPYPCQSTGQPPLSMTKHRFPTKSQSTCQYHLCKNLRISCAQQKSLIGRWRMEEEDKLEWDRERKYFI
jgi:hypothetical protein